MGAKNKRRQSKQSNSKAKGDILKDLEGEDDDEGMKKHTSKNNSKMKMKNKRNVPSSNDDPSTSSDNHSDDEDQSSSSDDSEKGCDDDESKTSSGSESDSDDEEQKIFTDENAKWLKPKNQKEKNKKETLIESDDDDDDDGGGKFNDDYDDNDDDDDDDDDGDDDDNDDDLLEIEKQSRIIDEEMEAEREEAEQEMRETITKHTAIYHLPTEEELEEDIDRVVPPEEIRQHIESILGVLADFKTRREQGRARSEYVDRLGNFMAELYGYIPELTEYFLTMFSPAEALEFISASDKPRPLVIRTNTLKIRRKDLAASLMKRGVTIDPLASWSKVGLKIIESPVPIGATPEYLSGMYMLQSAASMCPVMALGAQPKERVLDMSAAPGGKTSYIAQLMRNMGVIVANDLKAERQKATVANMHRLGVKNVITCAHDGRKLGSMFTNRFDRILLDAPCSGLGVISRDPGVKVQRTIADIKNCAHLQKELLLSAIDALNHKSKSSGGIMVYSTCSVSVAENEEVINYALMKRDIKIVDTGLDFGQPGFTRYQQKRFHPSVALTRRFYPHVHNMDGFFVAKIQKLSGMDPSKKQDDKKGTEEEQQQQKETTKTSSFPKDQKIDNLKDDEKNSKSVKLSNKKKRKQGSILNDNEAEESKNRTKKSRKFSGPPIKKQQQQQLKKKPKTNAKVTKPRRTKPATDGVV